MSAPNKPEKIEICGCFDLIHYLHFYVILYQDFNILQASIRSGYQGWKQNLDILNVVKKFSGQCAQLLEHSRCLPRLNRNL